MNKGTVKWFDNKKGYGFIKAENGQDVFVHCSAIVGDEVFKTMEDGSKVEFEFAKNEKTGKFQAANVKVVE